MDNKNNITDALLISNETNPNSNEVNSSSLYHNRFIENNSTSRADDVKKLSQMGYDKNTIDKLYIFLRPPNFNKALEYLSVIDGKIQHDYYEKGYASRCYICDKDRKEHQDYIETQIIDVKEDIIKEKPTIEKRV